MTGSEQTTGTGTMTGSEQTNKSGHDRYIHPLEGFSLRSEWVGGITVLNEPIEGRMKSEVRVMNQ
jgi:hypothetical protein